MAAYVRGEGPVKAWIEPDRLVFARAFPLRMVAFVLAVVACASLAYALHPVFWGLLGFVLLRQTSHEAHLRELFREGMLHPAQLVSQTASERPLLATLVRLDSELGGARDALVLSRAPWRWQRAVPPWGGERAAMVIAGEPPNLRPLGPDVAGMDAERARAIVARIPERQWQALARALSQLKAPVLGVHWVELDQEPWYGDRAENDVSVGMPPHLSENDTSLWCASLPCIEQPEMVERESARVRFLRRRSALSFTLRLLAVLLTLTTFALLASWATGATRSALIAPVAQHSGAPAPRVSPGAPSEKPGVAPPLWSSLLGLGLLFAAPMFLLSSLRALSATRALSRDLKLGRVRRFAGPLSNYDSLALDPDLALLFRRGLLRAEPGMQEELVVLPESGQLLYAGAHWAPPGMVLSMRRVADPPLTATKLSLPGEYAPPESDANVSLARRRMTDSEASELSDHARELRRPGSSFWWVFAFVAVALGAWHGEGFRVPPSSVGVPVALMAAFVVVWSTVRRVRLSLRIDRDVALGWVLTVDRRRPEEDSELPALGVETLLHAQLDWTVNQRPAAWRRFGRRR